LKVHPSPVIAGRSTPLLASLPPPGDRDAHVPISLPMIRRRRARPAVLVEVVEARWRAVLLTI
jgi:hypothetical protein